MAGQAGTPVEWDLEQFKVEAPRWRDAVHPPAEIYIKVERWWRLLKRVDARIEAVPVRPENNPEGNLWWMWVPDVEWEDEHGRGFRLSCYFRVYEKDDPPRLVCDEFRSERTR
ncbi:hypothetical protein ACWT_6136 [Actinoplanes sp. SE50]|uniref:hypothetical protein n=1 Tax=unclassified Actinoplanes TaxID=2626549 RepID=UPI00023ECBC7|nr:MULTISPECIES: hypothetical protein [unclassified Actinoplanes]AEV87153.1 hypothetical protein ACPL_6268 [Actinoplanes sp. SE50/110]ATO85551.1 hypothetical protein ACWT_6136 [Actinoplanes sp. SE50]SLM02964.1 hypothetical protein ACSP50_6249 [Actinoplanes sp. SE50/110]